MKPEKPKGKTEQDQEMRMPAKEFDRIMGGALGTVVPHKPGGGLRDNRNRERTPPIIHETKQGPDHPDRPPLGPPAREPEDAGSKTEKK